MTEVRLGGGLPSNPGGPVQLEEVRIIISNIEVFCFFHVSISHLYIFFGEETEL